MIAILCLLIALASVGGIAYVGSQSKFIPFLYHVDPQGHARAIGPVEMASQTDPRVLAATIGEFIANARLVTVDAALQRKAVYQVYAMLSELDPATSKMNQWMNGTEDSNPSNWWIPNKPCLEQMLGAAGFAGISTVWEEPRTEHWTRLCMHAVPAGGVERQRLLPRKPKLMSLRGGDRGRGRASG